MSFWSTPGDTFSNIVYICGLLWQNREQIASDIQLISDSINTNSVGYYSLLWSVISTRSILSIRQGHAIGSSLFVNHSSILHTVSIKTCLPFRVWTKECSHQHDNSIHCWFVLSETSQMSLATSSLLCQIIRLVNYSIKTYE